MITVRIIRKISLLGVMLLIFCVVHPQLMGQQSHHEREFLANRANAEATYAAGMNSAKYVQSLRMSEIQSRQGMTVFGYYPYWTAATYYEGLVPAFVTHIGYFSADADTNGVVMLMNSNRILPLREYCRTNSIALSIVLTMFGNQVNTKVLSSEQLSLRVISQTMNVVRSYQLDGVDIDAESVPVTQRANLVRFVRMMRDSLTYYSPTAQLSMATPAVDWSNSFDLATLASICHHLTLMGYDYYYSGSPTAGPVAPLLGESYNVSRSVQTYLQGGVPAEKLVLGVPWYGYEWAVKSDVRKAETDPKRGIGKSYTYAVAQRRAQQVKRFDTLTQNPWYILRDSSGSFQGWFDDSSSLAAKYGVIHQQQLQGVGIWALGYEGTDGLLRSGIRAAFSSRPLTVNEVQSENTLTIYPNPAQSTVTISSSVPIGEYSIVNLTGVEMLHGNSDRIVLQLPIHELPAGIYAVRCRGMQYPLCIVR